MIIELCGVPGAGKSHLAHALEQELRRIGEVTSLPLEPLSPRRPAATRIRRKLLRASTEVLGHPTVSVELIRGVVGSHQGSVRAVALRSLNLLVLRASLRRARASSGTHIFDQGIIQELGSLAFRGDGEAALEATGPGDARLGPDLIIVVEADAQVAHRRLEARPGTESRLELVDASERTALLRRQEALLSELLESWDRRFGQVVPTHVRRVENGHDGPIRELGMLVALITNGQRSPEAVIP